MDDATFQRELGKYKVVRKSDYYRVRMTNQKPLIKVIIPSNNVVEFFIYCYTFICRQLKRKLLSRQHLSLLLLMLFNHKHNFGTLWKN